MITVNLGLDNNPFKSQSDILQLFEIYFSIEERVLHYRTKYSSYVHEQRRINEKTAVFNVNLLHHKNNEDIDRDMKLLCTIFKQDSIAWYHNFQSKPEGYITHNVRYSGDKYIFNKDYFIF